MQEDLWNEDEIDDDIDLDDWEIIEDDWEEDYPSPAVGSPRRVDMTTRDRMHGGRHLKCRWGKYRGNENGEFGEHDGKGKHHGWGSRHGPKRFEHCAKKMIVLSAICFLVMMCMFNCCTRRSYWARRRYERLSDIHDYAVDRDLNETDRANLYRIYNNAGWCQQERLRKQIV